MTMTETFIEDFIEEIVPEPKGYLQSMRHFAEEEGVPIINQQVAYFFRFFLPILSPKQVLELGTAIGYSASLMAEILPDAHITTVEIDEDRAVNARSHFQNQGIESRVKLVVCDAQDFMKQDTTRYDFIFIDAAKGQYEVYLKEALAHLNDGGVICMDNVLFHGMLASKKLFKRRKITIVKRLRRLLHHVLQSHELVANLLPIGDGLLLIRRPHE